jgi:hypothetical protein
VPYQSSGFLWPEFHPYRSWTVVVASLLAYAVKPNYNSAAG